MTQIYTHTPIIIKTVRPIRISASSAFSEPARLARYRDNFFDKGTPIHVAGNGGGGGSSSGSFSHPTRAAYAFSTEDQSSPSLTLLGGRGFDIIQTSHTINLLN